MNFVTAFIYRVHELLMAMESPHKGSNAPSVRSTVVNGERIRPGNWFRVSALRSLWFFDTNGWMTARTSCLQNSVPLIPEVLFQNRWRRRTQGQSADTGSP